MPVTGVEARAACAAPILLYDGVCGLCDRFVQFVLRHDRRGTMRFAPLQGQLGQKTLATINQHAGSSPIDSVVLLCDDRTLVRSDAVMEVLRYLGGRWHALAVLGRVVPRSLRDRLYDAVARRRYAMFGRYDACS
ncbi:MAG: thiol-disulfide oxidoreductase DCC family protein, partial [Gemmatimonadaceae bacterium]